MSDFPCIRPEVLGFKPYTPGQSIESVRERFCLSQVIKMASNENPLGASPLVQRALRQHADEVFRYPASGNPDLVAALAQHHQVDAARVVVGNGSDELIDLLMRVLAVPGKQNIVASRPCFGIYSTQATLCGVALRQAPLLPDFSFDWPALLGLVDEHTAMMFVTTPDNPSGYCPPVAELEALARALPPTCLLVIDEAYMDFCDDESLHSLLPRLNEFAQVAIVRTFSKSRGLAGLRVGYGLLPVHVAEYVRRVRLPFSVNILAEYAALAALEDTIFYKETLRVVRAGREQLHQGLADMGCTVCPSMANFLLFTPPAGGPDAAALAYYLLERGIIVRPLGSYELPHMLRVTVGTAAENDALLCLLREGLHS